MSSVTFGATYFLSKESRQRNCGILMPILHPPRSPNSASQPSWVLMIAGLPLDSFIPQILSLSGLASRSEAVWLLASDFSLLTKKATRGQPLIDRNRDSLFHSFQKLWRDSHAGESTIMEEVLHRDSSREIREHGDDIIRTVICRRVTQRRHLRSIVQHLIES